MATLDSSYPTLVDLASRLDPEGRITPIAEVLAKQDPIIQMLRMVECNKTDGYLHSIRTGLPSGTWRKLYQSVQPTKSETAQVTDVCGNLEMYAEVDKDLADVNGNTAAWRMSEQKAFFEGMANDMAETIFYGNLDKHPERFMGLATRYNTLKSTVPASKNTVSGGGSTANSQTSIFIVGLDSFHFIYPKGSKAGLVHTDKGQVTKESANGNFEIYRDHYKWQVGTALEDWRSCVRVCNLEVSNGELSITGDNLIKLLIKAKNKIPAHLRKNLVMFCATEVKTALEIAALDKSCQAVKIVEASGQFQTNFYDIPIHVCESISKTEAVVTNA